MLRMKGSVVKRLAEYERTQWYSASDIAAYQAQRLEALLQHASQHVPYYRKVIQVPRATQLTSLPLLTKDILRKNFDDLQSDDLGSRDWYVNTSGGSTGEPARFIQDESYREQNIALEHLGYRMTGKDIGDPEVRLWGSERDIFKGTIGMRARVGNWVRNQTFLNAFSMSPETMKGFIEQLNAIRPKVVIAYAQSAYELAQFSVERSLPIEGVGAVMTSAGTLYPFMREAISQAFHAPVFNRYGSREVGDIATECDAHLGLHIHMENQVVEILDKDGVPCPPGQMGEIVVTSLHNYAMPLIRYRIGDMGSWLGQECTCGRGSALLREVSGRVVDTFLTKSGKKIDGEYFTHLIYFKNWVSKFQFVQEDLETIKVRIQKCDEPVARDLQEIEDKVRVVMGDDCKVEFEFVDEIPASSSGKYRYTISRVKHA